MRMKYVTMVAVSTMLSLNPASGSSQSGPTSVSRLIHYFLPPLLPLQSHQHTHCPQNAAHMHTHSRSVSLLTLFPLPFPALGVLKSSSSLQPQHKARPLHKPFSDPSGQN